MFLDKPVKCKKIALYWKYRRLPKYYIDSIIQINFTKNFVKLISRKKWNRVNWGPSVYGWWWPNVLSDARKLFPSDDHDSSTCILKSVSKKNILVLYRYRLSKKNNFFPQKFETLNVLFPIIRKIQESIFKIYTIRLKCRFWCQSSKTFFINRIYIHRAFWTNLRRRLLFLQLWLKFLLKGS